MKKEFSNIVALINQSKNTAVKAVNKELIHLYWNIGAHLSKQISNTNWGSKTVDELAKFIQTEHPELKGFTRRGLYRMKQFYEIYHVLEFVSSSMTQLQPSKKQEVANTSSEFIELEIEDIRSSIITRLSWTHHITIFTRCKQEFEIEFYLKQSLKEKYTVKELDRQISASLFERTILETTNKPKPVQKINSEIRNTIKDNYIFDFLNLKESYNENDLQKGLLKQMKNFILELGKDFLFVSEEYKLQVGNSDFYIDLLFFHRKLQCLIAFELKADKFKPEHLGKLNFYLEALDRNVKNENENPSIGILLCKDKDLEVVEYALSRTLSPTMVANYKTQLPDKKLLQQKVRELFENT